mmetsp:Transcript_11852/g.27685  ORF Transcript_11852/g.27685 Transcript_11852/m.27685 type:complete len:279 (+) Transcript_11852:309-1145(+)
MTSRRAGALLRSGRPTRRPAPTRFCSPQSTRRSGSRWTCLSASCPALSGCCTSTQMSSLSRCPSGWKLCSRAWRAWPTSWSERTSTARTQPTPWRARSARACSPCATRPVASGLCGGGLRSGSATTCGATRSKAQVDIPCIAASMRALRDHPRADAITSWPVAWSTELFANLNFNLVGSSWEVRRITVAKHLTRAGRAQPALLAHSKTGREYPLLTMYHLSRAERTARLCPYQLRLLNASDFVRDVLLASHSNVPSDWRLWRALGGKLRAPIAYLRDV